MKKIFFGKIGSTNSWVKENFLTLEDKTVVYTFNQTAGHGQFNREWVNVGENNLFFSIFLNPQSNFMDLSALTLYACCVLCDLFSGFNLKPKIKLPNDILINNKKIAGILAESVFQGEKLKMLCLGIGVNINAKKDILSGVSQPATALNLEQSQIFQPDNVLDLFLNDFFENYDEFINQGSDFIQQKYLHYQKN